MKTEIIEILLVMLMSIVFALVTVVPLHELGHLLGGYLAGYRFTSLRMFGIRIYRDYGRFTITRSIGQPMGQCLMHPRCIRQNPIMLIAGGIAANLSVGLIMLAAGIATDNMMRMVVCICIGGINLAMGLLNAIPDSPTNDGSTLKDAAKSTTHAEIYNRIMMIYRELESGRKYRELSEDLLAGPDIYDSTLAAELALYRYYRIRDLYGEDSSNRNLIRLELLKLTKYAPGTGVMEAIENA